MKATSHSWKLLPSVLGIVLTGTAYSQNFNSGTFFTPAGLRAQHAPGATSGTFGVTVDLSSPPATNSNPGGNPFWNHSATGFAQTRAQLGVISALPGANLDVQLAGYTETTGTSLVFGRSLTTRADLAGIPLTALQLPLVNTSLNTLVSNVVGTNTVNYNWNSTANVTGLNIAPNELYRVTFTVTTGDGLPVNVLDTASFGITTPGIQQSADNDQLLDLIGILTSGGSRTGEFSFDFTSNQALSALGFAFSATDTVGLKLLGGTEGNNNVLTFSNLQVTPVPEPSSLGVAGICAGLFLFRRRRAK